MEVVTNRNRNLVPVRPNDDVTDFSVDGLDHERPVGYVLRLDRSVCEP